MTQDNKIDINGIVGAAVGAAAAALQVTRTPPPAALIGLRLSEIPFALFCYNVQGRKVKMVSVIAQYTAKSGEHMSYRYGLRIWDNLCAAIEMIERHQTPQAK